MPDEHYFTPSPDAHGRPRHFTVVLRGQELALTTEAGVFSRERVDRGSRLLIAHMVVGPTDEILDLGCGYGVVGLVAARLAPQGRVTMVDINARAVRLAQANVRANTIGNAEVLLGDGFAPVAGRRYDAIALNPPVRAGFGLIHRLIEEAPEHLRAGGRFYLVGLTRQGVKRLAEKMRLVFGGAEETAKGGGYRVYVALRP